MMQRVFTQAVRTGLKPHRPVVARMYHENIVDHYENPRNVGSLDKNDPNVGTVSETQQSCSWTRLTSMMKRKC